jgi:hypothetical protein
MSESHPIPAIAMTAFQLTTAEFRARLSMLGAQTLVALELEGDWRVDFDAGTITRPADV